MRVAACLLLMTAVAAAAPPEPSGPHPRILLDAGLRAAWKSALDEGRGPLLGAVALCDEDSERKHEGALYMGAEWAKMLQACLVAWAATEKPAYAAAAIKYFTALLDDLEQIGDGKGGDKAAIRDSGYAIRNLGPYTAIAYDWLHDLPAMTPQLRAHARQRWAAWLAAYKEKGYHPRDPGSNYHAGYLAAATLIAIAQGSEAAEESGPVLWKLVADEFWGKDMAAALADGGALDGGDWNEGWQYGPLSVAEYALAARVARAHGIRVDGVPAWLASVLRRHVYALSPSDRLWAGGDFDTDQAYMPAQVLALAAVALGDAGADDKRWARGELARLKLTDKDNPLYAALATIGDRPALVPRASWPTWYQSTATATLFVRTTWDQHAVWFVAACAQTDGLDHRGPNAGNFVLSRGAADLIVDPSPYGSLSTLTGNAPTVMSRHLPPNYVPSQGAWGKAIAWRWATQTRGGVAAARCDYADAYRFQGRKTDVPEALRDFVLLPSADGHDASLVIVDRAITGDAGRKMYLRFRVPAALTLDKAGTGAATIGDARVTISGAGAATIGRTELKDCFKEGTARGNCDAARLPVTDYRVEVPGPEPRAVHVIDATDARGAATHSPLSGEGWTGIRIGGTRDAVVVWPTGPGRELAYRAPRGKAVTHVVLDAPSVAHRATVSATADGDACAVKVTAGGPIAATPVIVALDDACAVTPDPEQPSGVSAEGKPAAVPARQRVRRSGCCGAQSTPGSPIAMSLVLLALLRRRRAPG
ncbi:MAG TPA: MYXO-CTERM sorting domain-containing protein [Kofleriaceae bacterium]|nr:MYXO-CTERM sorting domain-containing protein [Kofleriaceae bacterium]